MVFIPYHNVNFKIFEKKYFLGFLILVTLLLGYFIFLILKAILLLCFKFDCFLLESIKVVKVFIEIDLRIINLLIGNIFLCKCYKNTEKIQI